MTDFKKDNPTGCVTSIIPKEGKVGIDGKLFQVSEKQLPYLDRYHADDNVEYSVNKDGIITFLRKLSTEFKTANQVNPPSRTSYTTTSSYAPSVPENFETLVAKNLSDMDIVVEQAVSFFSIWEQKLDVEFTAEDKRCMLTTIFLQSKR